MLDGDLGPYSDVWGLGCVLYHMIYGIPLHSEQTKHKNRRESLEIVRLTIYYKYLAVIVGLNYIDQWYVLLNENLDLL